MELTQLYYFYVASQYEHITKAAKTLNVAQPALTQAIRRLEEELGVSLFDRKGRGIVLNPYGKVAAAHLEVVFGQLQTMKEELERLSGNQSNTIRLNILAASLLMTEILIAYKKKCPECVFQLMQNETDQECDICISTVANADDISVSSVQEYRDVFQENIYLAVPAQSPYATRKSISLTEVADADFISLAGSKPLRSICDQYCQQAGFTPNIIFESDSPSTVHDLISAGLGVGFWPAYSWGDFSKKELVLLPIDSPNCQRSLILTCSNRNASLLVQDFYQFTYHYMKNLEHIV
ncbi:MAG: LysR family transcriptional regulator [Lachnospiraceae bacterium]|nr:LysR family transcriptional regulator [Lachnospiraceae bacterium]